MAKIFFLTLLTGAVLVVHAQKEQVSGPIGHAADQYLSRTEPFGFSGAVLISKGDKILLNKGYGFADRENKTENSVSSVFSTGSLTKQFTAAAIMKLEMMGKLTTDDYISAHFDAIPPDKQQITLRHLLTHTSGLPLAFSTDDFNDISKEGFLNESLTCRLAFEPGANFAYSNVGYGLLAVIIENTSGMGYEEFLQENLFLPAGMTQTGYGIPDWNAANFVHIYNGTKDNGTMALFTKPTWHLLGNGGILSTTGDISRWVNALKGNRILSAAAKAKMFTPFKNDYAFGWDVLRNGGLRQHNGGSSKGNGAELRWFVKDDLFTIVFTNSTIDGNMGFAVVRNELEALVRGDSIPLPPEIIPVDKNLDDYAGEYLLPSGGAFEIKLNEGVAKLMVNNQELLDLLADPENYKNGGINVELNKNFEKAFSDAFSTGDFKGFDFTGASGELENEIRNELKMEGIDTPQFKIVRTLPAPHSAGHKITRVAINASEDFEGESLMLNIVTRDSAYVGIGVDFGFVSPVSLSIFPVGANEFQLYDLNEKIGARVHILKTANNSYTFSVGKKSITGIEKKMP